MRDRYPILEEVSQPSLREFLGIFGTINDSGEEPLFIENPNRTVDRHAFIYIEQSVLQSLLGALPESSKVLVGEYPLRRLSSGIASIILRIAASLATEESLFGFDIDKFTEEGTSPLAKAAKNLNRIILGQSSFYKEESYSLSSGKEVLAYLRPGYLIPVKKYTGTVKVLKPVYKKNIINNFPIPNYYKSWLVTNEGYYVLRKDLVDEQDLEYEERFKLDSYINDYVLKRFLYSTIQTLTDFLNKIWFPSNSST